MGMDGPTDDELRDFWAMTPEQHIIQHLGYSMMSVRDLPPYACEESQLPFEAMAGCREALYLHARLVAEFFVRMPHGDWTAREFLPMWKPPGDLEERLQRVWLVASKHIAHMSRDRVPDEATFDPEDTSLHGLTSIAKDCYRMLAAFVVAYGEHPDPIHLEAFTGWLRGRDTDEWVRDIIDLPPFRA